MVTFGGGTAERERNFQNSALNCILKFKLDMDMPACIGQYQCKTSKRTAQSNL